MFMGIKLGGLYFYDGMSARNIGYVIILEDEDISLSIAHRKDWVLCLGRLGITFWASTLRLKEM